MASRTKVAVLGGGVGSIVAAFELTGSKELRERFEVTVYQLGWRIGGKGASGRDMADGARILEHGLHVWFGFYDTAWQAMGAAYKELDRPPDAPLATLEQAFTPCDEIVLFDRQGDGWQAFPTMFPRLPGSPGEAKPFPGFWDMVLAVLRWSRTSWEGLRDERRELAQPPPPHGVPAQVMDLARRVIGEASRAEMAGAELLLRSAEALAAGHAAVADGAHDHKHEPVLIWLLTHFRDWLWKHVVEPRCEQDPYLRLFFTSFDAAVSTIAGIVEDGVLDHGFDVINDEEWCAWLSRHGAKWVTIGRTPADRAPILRSVYDVAFGYRDGEIAKADVAAGTATTDLLRMMFTYRGAFFSKMNAGMGDTVFGPFYEVLQRRGVRFEFFNAVSRLGLSRDGSQVSEIEVIPQVELVSGDYQPLVDVERLPCWPSEPLWEQLVDGERLKREGVNFELDPNPLHRPARMLRLGDDFDAVVLGISVASLPAICGELIQRHEPFRRAIRRAVTVRTQAFQLWLTEPTRALGWEHDPHGVAGAYVEPLDTYCDMSHLIPREAWPPGTVESIAYFCGVLDERAGETQDQATERAKRNAVAFLESDIGTLWPRAVEGGVTTPLRWDLLYDPAGRSGPARFDSQYWRANILGSERYVLTPAGTVKDRLPPGGSGVDNLAVAGDWTKTGVDGGCVEAAAISGVRAAHVLIGDDHPIPGEDPAWLRR